MNTLRNIKAKECCCGCTLRTGSLILLWISLICEAFLTLIYLSELLSGRRRYAQYRNGYREAGLIFLTFRSSYYLIASIAGMILCIGGIYGIQKNAPKYLNFGLFYLGYNVVFHTTSMILLIVSPTAFIRLIMNDPKINFWHGGTDTEFVFVCVAGYLFVIAALLYFWVIVRSCRDVMLKYDANGRAADEILDRIDLGFNPV